MITPRRCVAFAALCGTLALAGSSIHEFSFPSMTIGDTAAPAKDQDIVIGVSSSAASASPDESLPIVTGSLGKPPSSAGVSVPEIQLASVPPKFENEDTPPSSTNTSPVETPPIEASAPDSLPPLSPKNPVQLIPAFPSKATSDDPLPPVPPLALSKECLEAETCIDDYLWSLYERTPKVDTNKVVAQTKKAVKKDGKVRTIIQKITNYVIGDFTWKDPAAAQKVDMPLKDYVIGGMDPQFKLKLFRALRVIEKAGFVPGITSAFRDDYRQSIAAGNKAASDSSYHGGSRRGGFGHGLAADLVSVKGETRMERLASSDEMWKWIDAHEKELGIGRPYRDRDPPHVGPLDGKEYADKRGAADAKKAEAKKAAKTAKAETKKPPKVEPKKPRQTARHDLGTTKQARPEKSSKVSSLQTLAADR